MCNNFSLRVIVTENNGNLGTDSLPWSLALRYPAVSSLSPPGGPTLSRSGTGCRAEICRSTRKENLRYKTYRELEKDERAKKKQKVLVFINVGGIL